ncbi:MAG: cytochrome c oxidase assembly protein [Gordonia sp. (in: high G+C Gram-positive bacteria)]
MVTTRVLGGLVAAGVGGLVIDAVADGAGRYVEKGDPFPGAGIAVLGVAGYFLGALAAATCLGALAFVVAGARPDDEGIIDATVYRAHRYVAAVTPIWALLAWLMVGVAAADGYGVSLGELLSSGHLRQAIGVSEAAVAWLVIAVLATLLTVLIRLVLSWVAHVMLVIPTGVAVCALPMAGNAGQGPNHDYTTGLGILFALALALAVGYRVAYTAAPVIGPAADRAVGERRHARIVGGADGVTLVTGIALVAFLVPARYLVSTPFGVAALVLVGALAAVVGAGVWGLRGSATTRFWGVQVAAAGVLVGAFACWTVLDTRVAPGLLAHPFTGWDVFLGYALPGPPTAARLAGFWRFDLLLGVAGAIAAILYILGVRRLRGRGDDWPVGRTVAWLSGCVVLVIFTSSGIRAYGSAMFSLHMAEHMALNMFAPVLLVLGAPATLALRALPAAGAGHAPGPREWVRWLLHSRVTGVLSNPAVAFGMFVLSLYLVYFTPIFGTFARYHWGHVLLTIHFIVVGYLFFWVIIGVDPGPRRIPFLARIGLLFAVMPFHAFFGIALMTMTSVIGEQFYGQLALPWVSDRAADQWLGGAIAWGAGEVPVVLVVVAIVAQWAKSDRRAARRADRHADTYEDTELDDYNAMLDELARTRR